MNRFDGSSVVTRDWIANPVVSTDFCDGMPIASLPSGSPCAIRICDRTMSIPVTSSVTVCST